MIASSAVECHSSVEIPSLVDLVAVL